MGGSIEARVDMPSIDRDVGKLPVPRRLDAYLADVLRDRYSRREITAAIRSGGILLNGQRAKPKVLVNEGDRICGDLPFRESALRPEDIPLPVIYEDEWLLVVDKPAGMVVHPGAGNKRGTLVQALLGKGSALSTAGGAMRPGIVHRLDKDTSGLLLVAKNNFSHRFLQSQFASRRLKKTYAVLVRGDVPYEEGHVDKPIARHPKVRRKMAVSDSPRARSAQTFYRVVKRFGKATFLEARPLTGRTHQIRVHLAYLGHPIAGDELYGTRKEGERLALHASAIEFVHPKTRKVMRFESPLPDDFKKMLPEGGPSAKR